MRDSNAKGRPNLTGSNRKVLETTGRSAAMTEAVLSTGLPRRRALPSRQEVTMSTDVLIKSRIRLAADIIKKLDTTVYFTSSNRGLPLLTDKLGLTDHAAKTQFVYDVWNRKPEFVGDNAPHADVLANTIEQAHGNCDMKAECAYSLIRNGKGGGPRTNTKIVKCQIPHHTFCLLCSDDKETTPSKAYSVENFGLAAVVIDGWQSDYYAPNVHWPWGRVPGPERFYWRKRIEGNQITVVKVFSFWLN
jgi:hypothetical protein